MYIPPHIFRFDAQQQVGPSVPVSLVVPGAGAAARERLQELLRDPAHRFHHDATPHLLELVSQLGAWPRAADRLPALVWCNSGGQPQTYGGDSRWRLLVGHGPADRQPELHAALVGEPLAQFGLPAHLPAQNKFPCPPKDAMDVIGEMLALYPEWRVRRGRMPPSGDANGFLLRQALAEWLQTPEGRRCAVPASLLRWRPVIVPVRDVESPAAAAAQTLQLLQSKKRQLAEPQRPDAKPPADTGAVSNTSPPTAIDIEEIEADTSLDGPAPVKAARLTPGPSAADVRQGEPTPLALPTEVAPDTVTLVAPTALPDDLVQRSRALAQTLRSGDWVPALDMLVVEMLAHLPSSHPLHAQRIEVQGEQGPPWKIGERLSKNPSRKIVRDPQNPGSVYCRDTSNGARHWGPFCGPDAILRAAMHRWVDEQLWPMSRIRSLLAAAIDMNPVFVGLCLRLAEEQPHRDPSVQLRRCRQGTELQPAGRQLLESAAPRNMRPEEIWEWHRCPRDWAAMQQRLVNDNVCLLDAKDNISPLGATANGTRYLRELGYSVKPMRPMEDAQRFEAFTRAFPMLLHEEGSEAQVRRLVTMRRDPVECVLDLNTIMRAEAAAARWRTEGALLLPLHQ